ncbi:sialin-like isoform X2 [Thrips palmi]|uniref:Sialin n=1 Tax=Thrips palmi TaxID=161013 RepID=A0A6P8YN92_THRPL|nr:sialin-like isoform X2 [Thrips palmi]
MGLAAWVQQRYVLYLMLFLAVLNMYTMRVCLSVAIVQMAHAEPSGDNATEAVDPERCPENPQQGDGGPSLTPQPDAAAEFAWDSVLQGFILSSFYYGYVVSHLPGGVFADRFGGKHALGLGLLITSLTTLLSPPAARLGAGWLITLRVFMGLGEGVTFPAISALLSQWVPPKQRSRVGAFVYAGGQLGTVLGNAISGLLLHNFDWPITFYFFGLLGVIWYVLWVALCFSTPNQHPFISAKEREYLNEHIMPASKQAFQVRTPWRGILTSLPVWGLVVIQVGHDWGFFTMLTDLPKYMRSVLRFDIATNGVLSSLPYLTMWVMSLGMSAIADWLLVRNILTLLQVRRVFTSIASLVCAAGMIGASCAGCNWRLAVGLLTAGLGGMAAAFSGMRVNALDLTRNHAGTVMALVNGGGAVSGIVSPMIIGLLTPHETMAEWRLTFWVVFVVLVVTNFIYVAVARAEIQPWDAAEDAVEEVADEKTPPVRPARLRSP